MMKNIFLFPVITFLLAGASFAQTTEDDIDAQSWNDLSVTVAMSKRFDFFLLGTMRFNKDVSRIGDKRIAVGYVWKPFNNFSVSPFYWSIRARNARGFFQQEQRLNLRLSYKFPIKMFGLSHRSLFERRLRRPLNSWRYRPSITVEKDVQFIPKAKFYLTEEVFYDSIIGKFSRNRISAGITKTFTKKFAADFFFMHQNDGYVHPGDWNVIGTAWKVKL